ncbi:MAG: hypothetical protein Q7T56_18095, partial [Nocardioidaceae bacterium]|nr:hypothetical protein [Nocardioidaceae bacterium]
MPTAVELHRRGRGATNAGRFASARTLLTAALDQADDPDTRVAVQLTLAHVETETGSTARGLTLCEQAVATPGTSPRTTGLAHGQLGLVLMRSGTVDRALTELTLALDHLAGDDRETGRVLLNRGTVHLVRGDGEAALRDFGAAAASLDADDDAVLRAQAQHNEGYASLLQGDLVAALRLMDAARPVLAPLSTVSRAVGDQDRAEVLTAAGMVLEAELALTDAVRAFGARRARQHQGEAELALARLLLAESPRRARTVARRAARRLARRGSTGWALRADAVA